MPYPHHTPSSKHDLIGPPFRKGTTLQPQFTSIQQILQALDDRRSNNNNNNNNNNIETKPEKISVVYGYKDDPFAPKDKPPSKSLEIIGYFSLKTFLPDLACESYSFDRDKPPVKGVSSFHIGVKRVDDERIREKLMRDRPKEVENSDRLASFCEALRNDAGGGGGGGGQLCAVLNFDKYERILLVKAMDKEEDGSSYAAHCFMTKLKELKDLLSSKADSSSTDMPAEEPSSFGDTAAGDGGGDGLWQPPGTVSESTDAGSDNLWQPPGSTSEGSDNLWQPPGSTSEGSDNLWQPPGSTSEGSDNLWQPPGGDNGTNIESSAFPTDFNNTTSNENGFGNIDDNNTENFHSNKGAAAADEFYSNLVRQEGTRADSILYHMRNYNGWVKATQIAELNPRTNSSSETDGITPAKKKRKKQSRKNLLPLRVLDLACGKGGDLGKWTLHNRKIRNYVGIDVARGSLVDAAIRARKMRKQLGGKCVFTCADLGSDVPGRPRTRRAEATGKMQKLLSWSLEGEAVGEDGDPVFTNVEGGGVKPGDKFDVVSIQFAIHYMMQTRKRARRFFHTVSQLLDIGGNLVATTIDARVVLDHLMNAGFDLHFGDGGDKEKHEIIYSKNDNDDEQIIVSVGEGLCQLKFERDTVKRMFTPTSSDEELFGLEYTFTLTEGQDHAAGVGQAVDLPEWLIPLPVLNKLAKEAGLTLEYAQNFHEFFMERRDPVSFHSAHNALYSMNVLNRDGSISKQEWDISRMYMAVRYRKDNESNMELEEDDEEDEEDEEVDLNNNREDVEGNKKKISQPTESVTSTTTSAPKKTTSHMFMKAMLKAKALCTPEVWNTLTSEERTLRTNDELKKLGSS